MSKTRPFRRVEALRLSCPKCGVPSGKLCRGPRGALRRLHPERLAAVPYRPYRRPGQTVLPLGDASPVATPKPAGDDFYLTDAWRAVRYKALKRSSGACECCGAGPMSAHPLHVDHIKPRSRFPELALVASNLQVLCEDCNVGKGSADETDWRPSQKVQA